MCKGLVVRESKACVRNTENCRGRVRRCIGEGGGASSWRALGAATNL